MIVISTYNDVEVLNRCLLSLNETNNFNEILLIVCSCPKQKQMIEYLKNLNSDNFFNLNIEFSITPYSGYDTGSYLWAFKNYSDEYYIFLQDSLVVNKKNWLDVFKEYRELNTLNTWCHFELNDEFPHTDFFFPKMGFTPQSLNGSFGVFGPMFQISRKSLETIDKKFELDKFIPSNKMEACAMERGWTYLSTYSDIKINSIDGHYTRNISEYSNKLFTKIFNNRI